MDEPSKSFVERFGQKQSVGGIYFSLPFPIPYISGSAVLARLVLVHLDPTVLFHMKFNQDLVRTIFRN